MFIAVYEFEVKTGKEALFREAWLKVTKAIYQHCGSFGSRLHTSDKLNTMVAYAQWPSQAQWEKVSELTDAHYQRARDEMNNCLVQAKTVYKLEVSDDYLQSSLANGC